MKRKPGKLAAKYELAPDINLDQEIVLDSAGGRITEARAQEMAAYALQEARRGRRSVTGERGRTPTLTVRVDPGTRAELESIARAEHRVLSEIAREALTEYLRKRARPAPSAPRGNKPVT